MQLKKKKLETFRKFRYNKKGILVRFERRGLRE